MRIATGHRAVPLKLRFMVLVVFFALSCGLLEGATPPVAQAQPAVPCPAGGCGTNAGPVGGFVPPRTATHNAASRIGAAPTNLGDGPSSTVPLTNHGGAVIHTPTVYNIFWAPSGYTYPAGYQQAMDQFQADVAAASGSQTNVYAAAAQYNDASGYISNTIRWGGSVVDTKVYPTAGCAQPGFSVCLSETQLNLEVQRQVAAVGWPAVNPNVIYNLFLPSNITSCIDNSNNNCAYTNYCAYHTAYATYQSGKYVYTPWALMMDLQGHPTCEEGVLQDITPNRPKTSCQYRVR